ncbi:MAG: hypothetical protein MUF69_04965, partial [Desulfobacterota bacterium]|nr:hypothetical protein [Thermodesulfobacteriota bacterium]
MVVYLSRGADAGRLLERFNQVPAVDAVPSRAALLKRLGELTLSENELAMDRMGFQSIGQVLAQKFWYRLAYHLFREFPDQALTLAPAIEEKTGRFFLVGKGPEGPLFQLVLPREKVRAVLRNFQDQLLNDHQLALSPVPLKSLFKISATTEMDLEIRPLVEVLQADGERRYLEREELEKYRYGDLIYVKELGLLAELERPGAPERKFTAPVKMVLKKSQVPEFLQEYGSLLKDETQLVDASVKNLKIFDQAERLEILPEAIDRDWCWLSVRYGFGQSLVSLWDILETRREGQRYLAVPEGWVDCRAPEWDELAFLEEKGLKIPKAAPGEKLKLS